jgi:hypothetical protein
MFQDIRMPRRSLKEVLPGNGSEVTPRAKKAKKAVVDEDDTPSLPPPPRARRQKRTGNMRPKLIWTMIVLVVVVAATFLISKTLSVVSVEIVSKQFEVALNGTAFTAPYESVTIPTIKDSRTVTAKLGTGTPKKASGIIVIYNAYSKEPQTLVANTRFQAASGKIYRISKAITVPGARGEVAGSVEATVTADQVGSAYNAGLTDFKIPGFKGDPKYDKFSAKSKTPMTGGSAGEEWAVNETEHAKVVTELKQSLLQKAAEQIRFQIPDNFVLYDSNIVPVYKEDIASSTLTLSIDARAIIFDREALSRALVTASLPQAESDQPFTIVNLDELSVTIDQNSLKSDDKKVTIIAEGQAKVKLVVDPDILRSKLVNVNAGTAQEILTQFPAILKAEVNFQPPWIRQFPPTVERIKVVIP